MRLDVFLSERERADSGRPLADLVLEQLLARGVQEAVLVRAAEGFGGHHRLRTDVRLSLSEDPPLVTVALDAPVDAVDAIVPRGAVVTGAPGAPGADAKLTAVFDRSESIADVCRVLRDHGAGGASAFVGIDGIRGGRRVAARFFSRNARVPAIVVAVGPVAALRGGWAELRRRLREPAAAIEPVTVLKRDGATLAELPDAGGRLTLYASESAGIVERAARELHVAGGAGATSLRGVYGFHGDHEPHGDRLLQIGRRVPVAMTTVDVAARLRDAYAIVDRLTPARGLITYERPGTTSPVS